MVSLLFNVDLEIAQGVADGLGFPLPALSLFAYPGDGSIKPRGVAILIADGIDVVSARRLLFESAGRWRGAALCRYASMSGRR